MLTKKQTASLWKNTGHILGWEALSFSVVLAFALGLLEMREFTIARILFVVAALVLTTKLYSSSGKYLKRRRFKNLCRVSAIIIGVAFFLSTENWVSSKENMLARIEFTFPTSEKIPILVKSLPIFDGVVSVPFTVRNISDFPAVSPDIWVRVCRGCEFAKEPIGFQKVDGGDEKERYFLSNHALNPTVSSQIMTIEVKPPPNVIIFVLAFKYACETCGVVNEWQLLRVHILRTI